MDLIAFELHVCLVIYGTIYDLWVFNVIATICSIHIVEYHELQMSSIVQKFSHKPNLQNLWYFNNGGNVNYLRKKIKNYIYIFGLD